MDDTINSVEAECADCEWTDNAPNAEVDAVKHAKKHKHRVYVDVTHSYEYNFRG